MHHKKKNWSCTGDKCGRQGVPRAVLVWVHKPVLSTPSTRLCSWDLISKPRNEAQIKAQRRSKRTIKLAGKWSRTQSKNQAWVCVPPARPLPHISRTQRWPNVFATNFLSEDRVSWPELNSLNQTADDLQLLPARSLVSNWSFYSLLTQPYEGTCTGVILDLELLYKWYVYIIYC